jgi:SAM-dependent methyltransferase
MDKENNVDFDKRAASWDQDPLHARRNDAVASAIAARVPLGGKVDALEFGCGTGELTLRLAPALGRVFATDASAGMVEQLERKLAEGGFPNISARRLDLLVAPPLDRRFDLIYSAMTLHHIEDVPCLFGHLATLLTPAGHLALADLCAEDGSFHGGVEVPHRGFAEEELAAFAAPAGLELGSYEEVFVVEKNGRDYPVFLAVFSHRQGPPQSAAR